MSNSISWLGNKVVDPNAYSQLSRSPNNMAADSVPDYLKSTPSVQQGSTFTNRPATAQQEGAVVRGTPTAQRGATVVSAPAMEPQNDFSVIDQLTQQGPPPSTEPGYIPNYLLRNIGKNVRAEFVIGSSQYIDKTGIIIEVGINYFVLDDIHSRSHVMCDMYSVKFVTTLQS